MPFAKGTEYETRTCPRRHLLRNPDLVPLFALRRSVEGMNGLDLAERLTGAAVEGLAVLDDAVATRSEQEAKERAKEVGNANRR